jgi:translation elongation factor EF-G
MGGRMMVLMELEREVSAQNSPASARVQAEGGHVHAAHVYAHPLGHADARQLHLQHHVQPWHRVVDNAIPSEFIAACGKGTMEAVQKDWPQVQRLCVVIKDGQAHSVASSELAFKAAVMLAIRQAFAKADQCEREPSWRSRWRCRANSRATPPPR